MSASLVGSEMCIRDRLLTCLMMLMVVGGTDEEDANDAGDDDGGEIDAVSYTHLTLPTICSV
eukprot:7238516-Alexandrium_andersonii.AAC.1